MVRIWLLAALLVLDAAFPLAARGEKPGAGEEKHDEATIKLNDRQVDAGKFAVSEVQGGMLSKRITVRAQSCQAATTSHASRYGCWGR